MVRNDPSAAIESARAELRADSSCRFLDAQSFEELLISTRRLGRSDDKLARTIGLVDAVLGLRFVIEEEKLLGLTRSH